MLTQNKLFSQEELAEYLGVTIHAVRKWRAAGKISFIRIGQTVRFEREAIEQFIADHHTERIVG